MKNKDEFTQNLVFEVKKDYLNRRQKRRDLELQWQLNINFLMGNQYSFISPVGKVMQDEKQYFWQEREVFNHIAPTVETRVAKISRQMPHMNVIPASTDESDIQSAKLSKEILNAVSNKIDLTNLTKAAITWSEVCGSVFYKLVWNANLGNVVAYDEDGKTLKEGDVDIIVCSPFEIFPDNLSCERIEDCKSIIHARAYDVDEIKMVWGKNIVPEKVKSFTLDSTFGNLGGLGYDAHINRVTNIELENHCILIEKYTRPTAERPNGRLTVVAGDELLFDGELPYLNDELNGRTFPFIRQVSTYVPGSFFGTSVVDRLIPIQRAYNAVKNRKHEYINRSCLGILAVEDGSIDTDALELEGLSPGKVLVYRQGGQLPTILESPKLNVDFDAEEVKLLDEFKSISGVSELMSETYANYTNMSGIALELLSEQDNTRLSTSIDSVKQAIISIAKNILRLYKQFAVMPRLLKIAGENERVEMFYWDNSELSSDDVVFDTNSDINETVTQRRNTMLQLLDKGLLFDKNGTLSESMRKKCLDLLGFGTWEHTLDINALQINRAQEENLDIIKGKAAKILSIDNHIVHVDEHIAFVLGKDFRNHEDYEKLLPEFIAHIDGHKKFIKEI